MHFCSAVRFFLPYTIISIGQSSCEAGGTKVGASLSSANQNTCIAHVCVSFQWKAMTQYVIKLLLLWWFFYSAGARGCPCVTSVRKEGPECCCTLFKLSKPPQLCGDEALTSTLTKPSCSSVRLVMPGQQNVHFYRWFTPTHTLLNANRSLFLTWRCVMMRPVAGGSDSGAAVWLIVVAKWREHPVHLLD